MMKRLAVTVCLLWVVVSVAPAQQFFKAGVVDFARVYNQFFKETKPVKDFDDFKSGIQKEIDKMKEEIRQINDQRNDAKLKGDSSRVSSLDVEILKRQDVMKEYARVQQIQINSRNLDLQEANFLRLLNDEIEQAAVSKGFGLILNKKDTAVIWFGPDADITDDVLARMTADLKR